MAKERGLGLGFGEGYERVIFRDEATPTKIGLTFLAKDKLTDLTTPLSQGLDSATLCLMLEDSFLDKDITELQLILPTIITQLSVTAQNLLLGAAANLSKDFCREIGAETIALDAPPESLAFVAPALYSQLNQKDKERVAKEMADLLPREFFNHYLENDYFNLSTHMSEESIAKVVNNTRTIQAFATADNQSYVTFRGKNWKLNHTHIHPGHKPNPEGRPEREYYIYADRAELADIRAGKKLDPNDNIVAEIHTILVNEGDNPEQKRFLAVGSVVRLGKYNTEFQNILDAANGVTMDDFVTPKNVLLNHLALYGTSFDKESVEIPLYDSWASLHIQDAPFQAGIRFLLAPNALEISSEQYGELHALIPELKPLPEDKLVAPVGRMPGTEARLEQEEIAIIGGGIAGVITAIQLARLKNDKGEALYKKVTLLEKNHEILQGASAIAARGNTHVTPGEYPKATDSTPEDCMLGALYYAQMIGKQHYQSDEGSKVFAVHKDSANWLTGGAYVEYMQKEMDRYRAHFAELEAEYGSETAEMFYGYPDEFVKVLAPRDYRHYLPDAAVAIKTHEKPFNMPLLMSFLKNELARLPNLKVELGQEVKEATRSNDGKFILKTAGDKVFHADQVVNASWENSFSLDCQINADAMKNSEFHVHARGMVLLNVGKLKTDPQSIFMLLGEAGGMYHRISKDLAFLYLPGEEGCYLGDESLTTDKPNLSQRMKEILAMPKAERIAAGFKVLKIQQQKFPFLKDATVIDMFVRPTVTNSNKLENRSVYDVAQITPGWHTAIPSKLMFGPLIAVMATAHVVDASRQKGADTPADFPLKPGQKLPTVLPKQFCLAERERDEVTGLMGVSEPELRRHENRPYLGVLPFLIRPDQIDAVLGEKYDEVMGFAEKLNGEAEFIYPYLAALKSGDISFVERLVESNNGGLLSQNISQFARQHLLPIMDSMYRIGQQALQNFETGLSSEIIYTGALEAIHSRFGNANKHFGLSFSLTNSQFVIGAGQNIGLVLNPSRENLRSLNDNGFTPALGHRAYAAHIAEKPGVYIQYDGIHKGSNSRAADAIPLGMSFFSNGELRFSVVGAFSGAAIAQYLSRERLISSASGMGIGFN